MSRHHILKPAIYTPVPPKPKEAQRKRGVGYVAGAETEEKPSARPCARRKCALHLPCPRIQLRSKAPSATSLPPRQAL
jgi:hypothetical protein